MGTIRTKDGTWPGLLNERFRSFANGPGRTTRPVNEVLEAAVDLNKKSEGSFWRLPHINELESLWIAAGMVPRCLPGIRI